jgi:hypothetical protein
MSLLVLCDQLRQQPFSLLSAECALALEGFFIGYAHANAAIKDPLRRATAHFAGSDEMTACMLAFLAGPDPRTSFHRALDAIEHELRIDEPSPCDVRWGPPLLDSILESIESRRTGIYLSEPTSGCLFETLNGYRCGTAALDPADAEDQLRTMQRFDHWVRTYYKPSQAPWYAILRIYGGPISVLAKFRELYLRFRATDGAPG